MPRPVLRAASVAVPLLLLAGCSDPRREVSGTVSYQGAPLGRGMIEFEPMDGQATRMDAPIRDGRFHIDRRHGLLPGHYRVRIAATGNTDPIPVPEGHRGPPPPRLEKIPKLPAKYNAESKLEAVVKDQGNSIAYNLD
jgi:hypothetical protein